MSVARRGTALAPASGVEACAARPRAVTSAGSVAFSPTLTVTTVRPSASVSRSEAPSLRTKSARTSGRSRTSQDSPTSSMPFSSSASAIIVRSPRGRNPERATTARATARDAVSFFMSTAPRPQT